MLLQVVRFGQGLGSHVKLAAFCPRSGIWTANRCMIQSHKALQFYGHNEGRQCVSSSKYSTVTFDRPDDPHTSVTARWMDSYQQHFKDVDKLNTWMTNIGHDSSLAESTKVVGALMCSLFHGLFAGQNSLANTVFWASLLENTSSDDCILLFRDLVEVCSSGLVPREEEQCDTFFRALFLKNDPELDVFLRQYADDCFIAVGSMSSPDDNSLWAMRKASIASMFPSKIADQRILRQPVVEWTLPALDLNQFRDDAQAQRLTPYGYTAYHFFQLFELSLSLSSAQSDPRETLYPTASMFTGCVLDALWARYYVTNDNRCLDRIMFAANEALVYIQSILGEKKGVNQLIRALTLKDDPARAVADLCKDYPEGQLIMSAGTSACLSLISNSESLPAIWAYIERFRKDGLRSEMSLAQRNVSRLLSVVKAAKDISKLTSHKLDA